MNPREFFIDPAAYGLPTRDELVAYRIWDNHFHGFAAKDPIEQYERTNFFVERMGIERSIATGKFGQHSTKIFRILAMNQSVHYQVFVSRFLPEGAHAVIVDPSALAGDTAHAPNPVFAPVVGQKVRAVQAEPCGRTALEAAVRAENARLRFVSAERFRRRIPRQNDHGRT